MQIPIKCQLRTLPFSSFSLLELISRTLLSVRAVGLNCLLFLDASCSAGPAALSHVPASPVYPVQTCPDTPFLTALLSFLPELSCVLGLVAGTCSELPAVPDGCPHQAASLNLPLLFISDRWLQIPYG